LVNIAVLHLTPTQSGELEGYLRKRTLPASAASSAGEGGRHYCPVPETLQNAAAFCVDEKSAIQALDSTATCLHYRAGRKKRR
jgi:hypothetical protein